MTRHVTIWLLLVLTAPIFASTLLKPDQVERFIRQDYAAAVAIFGGPERIDRALTGLYRHSLSWLAERVNEFRDRNDDSDRYRNGSAFGDALADLPADWAAMVKLEAYSFALRAAVVRAWLPWLGGLIVLAGLAGYFERKLRAETFSAPRPPVYNTAAHGVILGVALLGLWLFSPVPLPLAWMPMLAGLLGWMISLAIANYPSA